MYLGVFYVAVVLAFVVTTVWSLLMKREGSKKIVLTNSLIIAALLVGMRFAAPWLFHEVIYMGLILHAGYSVPLILFGLLLLPARRYLGQARADWEEVRRGRKQGPNYQFGRKALAGTYITLACLELVAGCAFWATAFDWQSAKAYKPKELKALPDFDASATYYTPKCVVSRAMKNHVKMSSFTALEEDADAVDVGDGIGYRVPLTPMGFWQHFLAKNYGFVTYDDQSDIPEEHRMTTKEQRFAYGEEMFVLDNLFRHLYSRDPFCYYPDVYYLSLKGKESEGYVAVAPQIKHRLAFPGTWVRYWAGVTLVYADGTIEHIEVADAVKDPRLQNKIIFPSDLTRLMVESQRYDQGYLSGLIRREDKIEVPELPANRQWPLRLRDKQGDFYDIIATEPDGENHALYKLFFVNKTSGEFSYYQYKTENGRALIGSDRAASLVKSLPYLWYEEHGQNASGTYLIVEPRFVVHNSEPYWVFTITTREMAKVISTAVVNAATEKVTELKSREAFNAWVRGQAIETTQEAPTDDVKAIRKDLEAALDQMTRLAARLRSIEEKK